VALTTFSDLVQEARERVKPRRPRHRPPDDPIPLRDGGTGAAGYAEAVGVYLGIALEPADGHLQRTLSMGGPKTQVRNLFGRQAIPMIWDFAENNVFGEAAGAYMVSLGNMVKALEQVPSRDGGYAQHSDARLQPE
jgi:putative DNA methylase